MVKGLGYGPSKEELLDLISKLVVAATEHYDGKALTCTKIWQVLIDVYHLLLEREKEIAHED